VISNFLEFRRDGKVIPEGMTAVQMITAGWEPDKVLRLQWDWDGHPIELASPYGLLSRIVRSREYLAVLEDTDATGYHARLSVYLSNGTLGAELANIVEFPETERWPAHTEPGEYPLVRDTEVVAIDRGWSGFQGLSQRRDLSRGHRRCNRCSPRNRRGSLGR
jgi:hypothetical protein